MNYEKYETYRAMKANLSKAMKAGFYYEAIFIEYAIMEDRALSVLKHAGVKYLDNRGWELKLSAKLNKIQSNKMFADSYVKKRMTQELISEIEMWKRDRDALIHALAKIPYDHDSIRDIADRGQQLVKEFDNKVKSLNTYFDKRLQQTSSDKSGQGGEKDI